jgi:hypothetical protein
MMIHIEGDDEGSMFKEEDDNDQVRDKQMRLFLDELKQIGP